jgi:hypothetical protein
MPPPAHQAAVVLARSGAAPRRSAAIPSYSSAGAVYHGNSARADQAGLGAIGLACGDEELARLPVG